VTAVLFDLDGVLADSVEPITAAATAALAERGHAVPDDLAQRMIGPPLRLVLAELLDTAPDDPELDALVEGYRSRYETTLRATPGFTGMPEALDALAAHGLRLGVATSKPLPYAEPVLDTLGLRDRFDVVEGPSLDGAEHKAQTLERALARLPGAFALVGDRVYDVVAAHEHGLVAVGVTWGIGTRDELRDADVLVEQPSELAGALLAMRR
jgi:phosphoglycolate phosphatase